MAVKEIRVHLQKNTQNAQSAESTERSVDQKQLTATIVITNKGEEVTSKEVAFQENESLLKVMKENFTIEEKMALSLRSME